MCRSTVWGGAGVCVGQLYGEVQVCVWGDDVPPSL